jgi:PAS domain S-box-containing protein
VRALLVEDNDRMRRLLSRALEHRGHAVEACADGAAAWAACRHAVFDLAVLDVVVPGLDGLEVCRRLRERPGGGVTAVLVVTGAVQADLAGVLAAGADDYLAKPFRVEELGVRLTVLERLAAERARRAAAEEAQTRLLAATRRVAASLDLAETLSAVADEALRLTDADVAVVAQPAPDGEHWALLATRGPLAWPADDPPTGIGQAAFARALRTGEPAMVPDYAAAGAPPLGPRSRDAGIRSSLAVPLRAGESTLGVFGAQSRRPGHFTPEHRRLLEGLAEAAALAVAHAQEVAQRREAEAALRASDERFRALVGNAPGLVYRCELDEHWTLHFISEFAEEITGYPAADFVGLEPVRTWASIVHPDDAAGMDAGIRAAVARREPFAVDYRVVRSDGGVRWLHDRGVAVFSEEGAVRWIDGLALDTTEQRRAEQERDALRARLARAEERERIAMDLHDVGVQVLFGLSMRLAAAQRRVGENAADARAGLGTAIAAVDQAMARLRGHVHGLRTQADAAAPAVSGALATLAEEVSGGTGFAVELRADSTAERALAPDAAEHVLHVAREALTNAARHGGARRAAVRLTRRRGRLVLTVRDDGGGFDTAVAHGGVGLANMRRRAELLGGCVTVASTPGRGTTVRLEIPVAPPGSGVHAGARHVPRAAYPPGATTSA